VENSANTESRIVEKSANTESQAMENSVNMENQVMHDSGGQETRRRKRCCSKEKASSTVVPKGYYQDTKTQIAKDASKRVGWEKEEEEQDYWFNHLRLMTKLKQK
jgi:hypothetical protein